MWHLTLSSTFCYTASPRMRPNRHVGETPPGAFKPNGGPASMRIRRLKSTHFRTLALSHFRTSVLSHFPYGITPNVRCDGIAAERNTRCVAVTKSSSRAVKMFTNVCGLRSTSGNHVLCTCTMMRCPRRKVW